MSLRQTRRTGIDPFAYMGIESISPLNLVRVNREPRTGGTDPFGRGDDIAGFNVGDFWINTAPVAPDPKELWILVRKNKNIATWVKVIDIDDFTLVILDGESPSGYAFPTAAGYITLNGSHLITTRGSGNTVTYDMVNGTDGQVLIGGPTLEWRNLSSSDGSVVFIEGPGALGIQTAPDVGIESIGCDAGVAFPLAGNVDIVGGLNTVTAGDNVTTIKINLKPDMVLNSLQLTALNHLGVLQTDDTGEFFSDNGTDGQVLVGGGVGPMWTEISSSDLTVTVTNGANTINLETIVIPGIDTLSGDTGVATPYNGTIWIAGGANINTFGDGLSTLQVNLNDDVTLSGTLTISSLGLGVVMSDAMGLLSSVNGTNAQILISSTAGVPIWASLGSSDGSITISPGSNTINLDVTVSGSGINTFSGDVGITTGGTDHIRLIDGSNVTTAVSGSGPHYQEIHFSCSYFDNLNSLTIFPFGAGVVQFTTGGFLTTSNGADGQLLFAGGKISSFPLTYAAPQWGNLTSTNLTVTPGPNTLDIINPTYVPEYIGLGTDAFLAHQPTRHRVTNIIYTLGSQVILTEDFDDGGNFFPGDGVGADAIYTAPATGLYYMGYNHICISTTPPPPVPPPVIRYDPMGYQEITTSRSNCIDAYLDTDYNHFEPRVWANYISVLCDLDAGDTVRFKSWIDNLYADVDGDALEARTFVCGYRVS